MIPTTGIKAEDDEMIGVPRETDPDQSTLRMKTSVATLRGTDTESMTTGTTKGIHRTVRTKERFPTIPKTNSKSNQKQECRHRKRTNHASNECKACFNCHRVGHFRRDSRPFSLTRKTENVYARGPPRRHETTLWPTISPNNEFSS